MLDNIAGKHIWIIGCSSGIGKALAKELSEQGAILALSARNQKALVALNDELGGAHQVLPFDVSNYKDLDRIANELSIKWPRIDSVIHLAASYDPDNKHQVVPEQVKQSIEVNLTSAFMLTHSMVPLLKKQDNGGQLVFCGSVAGYRGLPTGQPYCATKAAIINMAESFRVDYAPDNIDVKVICPGFVRTPLTDKNDFKMPMMIEPEEAAKHIRKGLTRKAFEIHFPKKFTYLVKFLRIMPNAMFFWLIKKVMTSSKSK
jgi:short-subunit dehydrogenase